MKTRELSLLLYIADVKSNQEQSFEFIHKVFGKKAAKSLVKSGHLCEHKDDVYVFNSWGGHLVDSISNISGHLASFENRDMSD